MRKTILFAVIALALVCPALHAQSGCSDSPEAPTAVLGLVGSAGLLASQLLRRKR